MTNVTTSTKRTDPRLTTDVYRQAHAVKLPDDVRKSIQTIRSIGSSYVEVVGSGGAPYRLDLSDPPTVVFRYYNETKDYWQPVEYIDPADITLLNESEESIVPDDWEIADGSDPDETDNGPGPNPNPTPDGSSSPTGVDALFGERDGLDVQLSAAATLRLLRGETVTVTVDDHDLTITPGPVQ